MADLERTYIIPLRKEGLKVPRYRRSKKAISTIRKFLERHMKSDDIKIGSSLNQKILERGRKNPPAKIQVKALKIEEKDNIYVKADLPNIELKVEEKKPKEKKEEKTTVEEKVTKLKEKLDKKEETLEEEKQKILRKPEIKKEKQHKEEKFQDKEKSIMEKEENIIVKTQKPHHEKKKS